MYHGTEEIHTVRRYVRNNGDLIRATNGHPNRQPRPRKEVLGARALDAQQLSNLGLWQSMNQWIQVKKIVKA